MRRPDRQHLLHALHSAAALLDCYERGIPWAELSAECGCRLSRVECVRSTLEAEREYFKELQIKRQKRREERRGKRWGY